MKQKKVHLMYTPASQTFGSRYVVTRLANKIEPHVGTELSEGEVRQLNQNRDVEVIITGKK